MKKTGWTAMGLIALLPLTMMMVSLGGCGTLEPEEAARRKSGGAARVEPVSVNALGRLEPRGSVRGISAAAGVDGARVGRLLVEEGQRVRAGQPLFTLDNLARLRASLEQARQTEALSEARLKQAASGAKPEEVAAQNAVVERLETEQRLAAVQWERSRRLVASGDLPAREAEQRRLTVETLAKEIARARAQSAALMAAKSEDVEVARREHEVNRAATARVVAEIDAATIVAPADGVILRVYNRPGEAATARVLDLGETGQMVAMAEVYEADIRRVRVGQPVEVTLPALQETLRGKVERVGQFVGKRETLNADPVAETEARVFRVQVALDPESSHRAAPLSNMQVEVKILP